MRGFEKRSMIFKLIKKETCKLFWISLFAGLVGICSIFITCADDQINNESEQKCYVSLPYKIYFTSYLSEVDLEQIFYKQSDCPSDVMSGLITVLKGISGPGEVNLDYINDVFSKELKGYHIAKIPEANKNKDNNKNGSSEFEKRTGSSTFIKMDDYLKEQMNCDYSKSFIDTRLVKNKQVIVLEEGERLSLESKKCEDLSLGESSFKLSVMNRQNQIGPKFLLTTKVATRTKVLKAKNNISVFNKANLSELFTEDYIDTANPELFFQEKNQLRYYQLNKAVSSDYVLKQSDLIPQILVQNGQNIKVMLEENNLKLTTMAVSRKSGKIGDVIDVYNPKSKKIFIAKIIDFNTVYLHP